MKPILAVLFLFASTLLLIAQGNEKSANTVVEISGELKKWHKVTRCPKNLNGHLLVKDKRLFFSTLSLLKTNVDV
ncbi:MAG: hypothetical protein AAF960_09720 [Bacteroidota bacterium]